MVECTFGRLKARWGYLTRKVPLAEKNFTPLVTACVVLYNICEEKGHSAGAVDSLEMPDSETLLA